MFHWTDVDAAGSVAQPLHDLVDRGSGACGSPRAGARKGGEDREYRWCVDGERGLVVAPSRPSGERR